MTNVETNYTNSLDEFDHQIIPIVKKMSDFSILIFGFFYPSKQAKGVYEKMYHFSIYHR